MSTTLPSLPGEVPALDPGSVRELADAVAEAARGLRYGSIEVVVHDARVVQITRTEKRRLLK
jgi:hypothetical protein